MKFLLCKLRKFQNWVLYPLYHDILLYCDIWLHDMWHRIWSCHGSTTCSDMKANCEGEEVYPWITSIQWSRQPHSSPHSLPHTNLVLLPSSQNLPTLPIPLSTIAYLMIPSITLSPASSTCWIISVRIPASENSFPFPIPSFLASEQSNIKWMG